MRDEAKDFLTRFEALHVAHCGETSEYIAGDKLSFADYYWLVTHDYIVNEMKMGDLMDECAPRLASCAKKTKQNPNLAEYLEENKNNAYVAMGFAF